MNWREEFLKIFRNQFRELKKRNPRCSVRMFAKQIGLSPGPTSELLKGSRQWKFSEAWAKKVIDKLQLDEATKNHLLLLMGENVEIPKTLLEAEKSITLSDWTYYPVLMSLDLPSPYNKTEQIAKRLGLSEDKVHQVLAELLDNGFIIKDEFGHYERRSLFWQSTNDIPNFRIKDFHNKNLSLISRAIDKISTDHRDLQVLTFVGDLEKIKLAKKEIRSFVEKVTAIMNSKNENDQVFQLAVSLFPFDFEGSNL
ncbi:MAG: TIGR02147 family protein [Pseudobdellovibrionaceae bacterium]